jgi:hypothetical protein
MTPRTRNPEEEYETQERKELVLTMLRTLPEDQRVRATASRAGAVELQRHQPGAERFREQGEG